MWRSLTFELLWKCKLANNFIGGINRNLEKIVFDNAVWAAQNMDLHLQVRNLQGQKQSINASDILSNPKVRVNNKLIIGNLNINSFAGKFDKLKLMVQHKVDILVLTETKIDSSFLNQQFHIEGFCLPYRGLSLHKGGYSQ